MAEKKLRAISPIMATIVLVIITIAMGAAFYFWANRGATAQMKTAQAYIQSAFIQKINDTAVEIKLAVTNKGTTPIQPATLTFVCPKDGSTVSVDITGAPLLGQGQQWEGTVTVILPTGCDWNTLLGYGQATISVSFNGPDGNPVTSATGTAQVLS